MKRRLTMLCGAIGGVRTWGDRDGAGRRRGLVLDTSGVAIKISPSSS